MSTAVDAVALYASEVLASCASGLLSNLSQPVPTIITAARTSYPWPLHLGNTLWSIVAYRKVGDALPADKRPGTMTAIALAFTLYAMGGSFVVNLLMLGQPPGVLQSDTILPVYVLCWLAVHCCPADRLFRTLSQPTPLFALGLMSEIDGCTTAFNYMEVGYAVSPGLVIFPVLCGLAVMLGGGSLRHFATHGFAEGIMRYDDEFRSTALYLSVVFAVYYYGALRPCGGSAECAHRTGLFEALTLFSVSRALFLEGVDWLGAASCSAEPCCEPAKAKAD
mmetsp:Transcript_41487/g.96134  ORF Transcript_41487/g.96134 Transcript_41487/m.96134 type:complete len:279 (+) Transcript_41487:1-837(+)